MMMVATWIAILVFLCGILGLKLSRWDKHYGEDPLRWHEVIAIVSMGLAMSALITMRLMQ